MPHTKESVKTKLIELICDRGGWDLIDYEESNLDLCFEDNGIDSLDKIELIVKVEYYFCISIPDKYIESIDTPNKFIDCLYEELKL